MKRLNLLYRNNPLFEKCPSCNGTTTLHRSKSRNMWESFVKRFTPYRMYRCRSCGWRGYKATLVFTKRSFLTLLLYILLGISTAYIVKYFLIHYVSE